MPPMKTPSIPAEIHTIQPTALYYREDVQRLLRLPRQALREAIKSGLRVSRIRGRYRFLGEWLVEWVRAGELKRKQALPPAP